MKEKKQEEVNHTAVAKRAHILPSAIINGKKSGSAYIK